MVRSYLAGMVLGLFLGAVLAYATSLIPGARATEAATHHQNNSTRTQ